MIDLTLTLSCVFVSFLFLWIAIVVAAESGRLPGNGRSTSAHFNILLNWHVLFQIYIYIYIYIYCCCWWLYFICLLVFSFKIWDGGWRKGWKSVINGNVASEPCHLGRANNRAKDEEEEEEWTEGRRGSTEKRGGKGLKEKERKKKKWSRFDRRDPFCRRREHVRPPAKVNIIFTALIPPPLSPPPPSPPPSLPLPLPFLTASTFPVFVLVEGFRINNRNWIDVIPLRQSSLYASVFDSIMTLVDFGRRKSVFSP